MKYTGFCINRLGKSVIHSVRVRHEDNSEAEIDAATYIKTHGQPTIYALPECEMQGKAK